MVSATQQTERIRHRRKSKAGKRNKRERLMRATPTFPVHPEGYNPKAADAKKA